MDLPIDIVCRILDGTSLSLLDAGRFVCCSRGNHENVHYWTALLRRICHQFDIPCHYLVPSKNSSDLLTLRRAVAAPLNFDLAIQCGRIRGIAPVDLRSKRSSQIFTAVALVKGGRWLLTVQQTYEDHHLENCIGHSLLIWDLLEGRRHVEHGWRAHAAAELDGTLGDAKMAVVEEDDGSVSVHLGMRNGRNQSTVFEEWRIQRSAQDTMGFQRISSRLTPIKDIRSIYADRAVVAMSPYGKYEVLIYNRRARAWAFVIFERQDAAALREALSGQWCAIIKCGSDAITIWENNLGKPMSFKFNRWLDHPTDFVVPTPLTQPEQDLDLPKRHFRALAMIHRLQRVELSLRPRLFLPNSIVSVDLRSPTPHSASAFHQKDPLTTHHSHRGKRYKGVSKTVSGFVFVVFRDPLEAQFSQLRIGWSTGEGTLDQVWPLISDSDDIKDWREENVLISAESGFILVVRRNGEVVMWNV